MSTEAFIQKRFSASSLDLIRRANAVIAAYQQQGYDLSLRQLYYQFVSRNWIENTERSYKRLGSVIDDGRKAGLIDWTAIKDRGRVPVIHSTWNDAAEMMRAAANSHRLDKWEEQPAYVEVMVEKQALEGVLAPTCERLQVTFTANKGYTSASAMYEASKRFLHAHDQGKSLHVLYLGDHDPSGIDMSRDVDDRLYMFLRGRGVTVDRLALNWSQVQEYNPPPNPAKMTDSRAEGYVSRFGEESWELDALDPSVLAQLVNDAVLQVRDEALWEEAVTEEERQRALLSNLAAAYESGDLDAFS